MFPCLCFTSVFHLLVFHVSVFHQLSRAVCFTRTKLAMSTNQRFETMVSPAHYIALHYMTPHNITFETMAGRAHCWGFWSAAHHRPTSSVFALVYVTNYIVGHCLLKWRYLVWRYFGSFQRTSMTQQGNVHYLFSSWVYPFISLFCRIIAFPTAVSLHHNSRVSMNSKQMDTGA